MTAVTPGITIATAADDLISSPNLDVSKSNALLGKSTDILNIRKSTVALNADQQQLDLSASSSGMPTTAALGGLAGGPSTSGLSAVTVMGNLPSTQLSNHKEKQQRRIIAEDPEWNLAPVEKLSELCVRVIVSNFEKTPILKGIPQKYRTKVLSSLSTTIPLSIAAPIIPDESYWQRRALSNFKNCDISKHDGSWKTLFFEKYITKIIQEYIPGTTTTTTSTSNGNTNNPSDQEISGYYSGAAGGFGNIPTLTTFLTGDESTLSTPLEKLLDVKTIEDTISLQKFTPPTISFPPESFPPQPSTTTTMPNSMIPTSTTTTMMGKEYHPVTTQTTPKIGFPAFISNLKLVAPFVTKLKIEQMKPTQPKDLEKVKNTDPYPDHVDLFLVVCYLVNLRELDVYYGVRDIGINFQWSFFGMTLNDCIVLSASLKNHSFTTPELLASYAELSKRSTQDQPDQYQSELTNSLNPRKNHEKNDGVKNVAVGVEKKMVGMGNSVACLRKLSVKMSLIDDEKCRLICSGLCFNQTLCELDLSHNKISDKGARGIAKVLSSPKTQLSFVNLSNNLISEVGLTAIGKSLSLPPPHKQPQSQQPSQQSPDPQPPHPNQTLKTLLLRMNKITDQAATNFFTSLLQNSTLQILDFSCNGLTFACVDSVCKVLKVSKSLVKLDLSCNKLGSCPSGNINTGTNNFGGVSGLSSSDKSGAAANVSAAAVSGGAGGANVGADGLKDGKENDTSSNVPHGAETLVKPLVEISNNNKNLSLQNSVDDVTGRLLFDAVSQNKYITALDLRVCDISQEYMVAIQAAVNENAQIP